MYQRDLAIFVTSYRRPHLLQRTLSSIFAQIGNLAADVIVADNSSSGETAAVIRNFPTVDAHLLPDNYGINWCVENLLVPELNHKHVLICDHDIYFVRPLSLYLQVLDEFKGIAVATGIDSPEHQAEGSFPFDGAKWRIKSDERGCAMVMAASTLLESFPLPLSLLDFDTHICSYLRRIGKKIAVLPGAAIHIGNKESTWQGETQERYVLDGAQVIKILTDPCD